MSLAGSRVEILSTGSEVVQGAVVDSNAAWLARELSCMGLAPCRHTLVGDDLTVLTQVLAELSGRADIVLVTGGLGSTADDLTARAAAMASGFELVLNEEALDMVRASFKRFGREIADSAKKQALLPQGSHILKNRQGIAPGFSLYLGSALFFFLPGVPGEMRTMFQEEVKPCLEKFFAGALVRLYPTTLVTFGLTESDLAGRLQGFAREFPQLDLGFRTRFPEVELKLYPQGEWVECELKDSRPCEIEQQFHVIVESAGSWIRSRLGSHFCSRNGSSLPDCIGQLLSQHGQTLALAESCTGGLLADLVTMVPGSSDYFLFSAVTYSNRAKQDVLGVLPATIREFGAVSPEVALEMARGVRLKVDADWGVALTGVAGPGGGSREKPVGMVCLGICGPGGVERSKKFFFPFQDRLKNKRIFAFTALEGLRRVLVQFSV